MIQNYNQLVQKISKASGKEMEDIERLVEAKRAKLSGLISREGAAQIVASELGLNLDKEKVKINELTPGIKKVNVIGKIIKLFPVREFKKNEREGKVANIILADDSGSIKTVFWDTNHIALFERGEILEGDFIEISNASLRGNEIHLSGFSDIKKSAEIIDNIKTGRDFFEGKISEVSVGGSFKIRAFIVQIFEPKFFEVCSQCGKKVINDVEGVKCSEHGKVSPDKRVLMTVVLDDGSGSIRAVLFTEQLDKLGLKKEDLEQEIFISKRGDYLGKEVVFSGNIRQNKFFNNSELIVSDTEHIELDKLIESLER